MFKELLAFFGGVVAAIAFLIGSLVLAENWYNSWRCTGFAELSGKEVKYRHFDTCFVKIGDHFVRYSEYENRAIAQNLKGE